VNATADEPLKLKRAVSATDLSSAVREYTIPSRANADGISVPVSPVVLVDPSSDPHRLVPQGWWLYQSRRVWTAGVGGGAVNVLIQVPVGTVGKLIGIRAIGPASAGATLTIQAQDEDGAMWGDYASIGAGASRQCTLPSIGTAANANANTTNSQNVILGPGSFLAVGVSTSLATETVTVALELLVSTNNEPAWTTTGAAAALGVLADNTISAANAMQKIDLPW